MRINRFKKYIIKELNPDTAFKDEINNCHDELGLIELLPHDFNELQKTFIEFELKQARDDSLIKNVYKLILLKHTNEATEVIVKHLESKHHIYTTRDDDKSEMWIYNQGIYVPEGKTRLKEEIRNILGDIYKVSLANTVLAKIEADTGIDQDKFFESSISNINEIPMENGIYNLKENKLLPFNPKKIFFNKIPVEYNPTSKCPNIEQHFRDTLKSEDDVKVMFELFGYLLWKNHFIEKGFMMVGNGRNGKSKTIDLMKRFTGIENCASVPLENMNGDNFVVAGLFGKMANLAGDLSNTALKDTGLFKQITGRDIISANRKFKTPINFENYSKQIFACNELPRVYDTSLGFWSRWILFEFPYTFLSESEFESSKLTTKKKMNPDQIVKLTTKEELSGLFNVAVEKLSYLLSNKNFSYSTGTDAVKQFWIRTSNSFAAFCMDHIKEDYVSCISKKDLRKAYHKYCKEHNLPGTSDKSIKITLEAQFGVSAGRIYNQDTRDQVYTWEGINFSEKSKYKYQNSKIGGDFGSKVAF